MLKKKTKARNWKEPWLNPKQLRHKYFGFPLWLSCLKCLSLFYSNCQEAYAIKGYRVSKWLCSALCHPCPVESLRVYCHLYRPCMTSFSPITQFLLFFSHKYPRIRYFLIVVPWNLTRNNLMLGIKILGWGFPPQLANLKTPSQVWWVPPMWFHAQPS